MENVFLLQLVLKTGSKYSDTKLIKGQKLSITNVDQNDRKVIEKYCFCNKTWKTLKPNSSIQVKKYPKFEPKKIKKIRQNQERFKSSYKKIAL